MAATLILNRAEIEALVSPHDALEPMRDAFRLYSTQCTVPALRVPSPLPPPAPPDAGAMILVPGVVAGIPAYTVKVHAKHPGRDPAIQGVIILSSLESGATLAILESGFLTALRTGLAGAIAVDVLARPDVRTVAIIGAGVQGILQLEMLLQVRSITRAWVYDISADRAREFAARNSSRLGIEIEPADKLTTALRDADIVVTATWANEAFLHPRMVRPGTHITTLGADQPGKAEVSADLLRSSLFVCDDRDLAVTMGAAGGAGVGAEVIDAELGQVIAGVHPGRTEPGQITIFGSVGLAFQDLVVAWLVYRGALERGIGHRVDFLRSVPQSVLSLDPRTPQGHLN
jgi:ornithine cyclodeaminase/alanine dehydrogenase-like protein (mu-crystallin family)